MSKREPQIILKTASEAFTSSHGATLITTNVCEFSFALPKIRVRLVLPFADYFKRTDAAPIYAAHGRSSSSATRSAARHPASRAVFWRSIDWHGVASRFMPDFPPTSAILGDIGG
jgi:hypothetical protein